MKNSTATKIVWWLVLTGAIQYVFWFVFALIKPSQDPSLDCWLWTGANGCSIVVHAAYAAVAANIFLAIPTVLAGLLAYAIVRMMSEGIRVY